MSEEALPGRKLPRDLPEHVVRHALTDRIYHWVMAASVLTLLGTSFFPIIGWKFAWVAPHWIAGLVLAAAISFHIVRAVFWQDLKAMAVGPRDLANALTATRRTLFRSGPEPAKPGKYPLLQRLYHHAAALAVLTTVGSGGLMMVKVDTPFWQRNPYWLPDDSWGLIYVLHGLAALSLITLVMLHVYFAARPEKLWITRSMLLGWITRRKYLEHHDPESWVVDEAPASAGNSIEHPSTGAE